MEQSQIPQVTIGIPAYNEAANIAYLLKDIFRQLTPGFELARVIVISDGSDDDTVMEACRITDPRLMVIEDHERHGQAPRQNEIIALTQTDILVLLNADIALEGEHFLAELVRPLVQGESDFTSSRVLELEPQGPVGRALSASEECKRWVIERWKSGANVFTCSGRARAFGRKMYERLVFTESVGEDMYSYFWGITQEFRYAYVPRAVAFMKLPETLQDFFRQSVRFVQSKQLFGKSFGNDFVRRECALPKWMLLEACILTWCRRPIDMTVYLILFVLARCQYFSGQRMQNLWEVSATSKKLK